MLNVSRRILTTWAAALVVALVLVLTIAVVGHKNLAIARPPAANISAQFCASVFPVREPNTAPWLCLNRSDLEDLVWSAWNRHSAVALGEWTWWSFREGVHQEAVSVTLSDVRVVGRRHRFCRVAVQFLRSPHRRVPAGVSSLVC